MVNSFYLEEVTEIEIINIIKNLKNTKSPGLDEIRSEHLKEIDQEVAASTTTKVWINMVYRIGGICPAAFILGYGHFNIQK